VQRIGHGVAAAVRQMELGFGVGIGRYLDPLIIDHNLVLRFDIVVDEHLFAADHRVTTYLARIKPTHPNVGHHAIREIEAEVDDIVEAPVWLHIGRPARAR
jgi:hypothetical protein